LVEEILLDKRVVTKTIASDGDDRAEFAERVDLVSSQMEETVELVK